MSSSSIFQRRRANDMLRQQLPTITDDDHLDSFLSDSTEPSLTNSSVSNTSVSSRNGARSRLAPPGPSSYPLHSSSSLLDITRDESHDEDDVSIDLNESYEMDDSFRTSNQTSLLYDGDEVDAHESSIMEKSINMSESLSGSFCTFGNEVNNSCTMPDCTSYISDKLSSKEVMFSDRIVQIRLMEDFSYLLGSGIMPCCAEKSLFTNIFGRSSSTGPIEVPVDTKIRNRSGESWRARAYRIKRLREERMIQDTASTPWESSSKLSRSFNQGLNFDNIPVSRSSSYSHQQRFIQPVPIMKPKQEVNSDPLGRMIGDCIEPISPLEGNDVEVEWTTRQEDLCYDSDPGVSSYLRERQALATHAEETTREIHCRSKSDACITVTPKSPKNWFRSPRRRRRQKSHFDSFDDSLTSEYASSENCAGEDAAEMLRSADFYHQEDEPIRSSPSFDDFDAHSRRRGKKITTSLRIDRDIQSNVQVCLARRHFQFTHLLYVFILTLLILLYIGCT